MSRKWFSVKASAAGNAGQVQIFSDIGRGGVTVEDFHNALDGLGKVKTLNINISSDGGDVAAGFAMYNMLAEHPARKVVTVQGLAASMASVIAMAGDEIRMPENSMLMIHNPWGAIVGESDTIASFADALAVMQDNIAKVYASKSGKSVAEISDMMNKETWLSAKSAVAKGFADKVVSPLVANASFDLSKFAHAPEKFARTIRGASPNWTVGASRDLPLVKQASWDGPAAAERVLAAAGFNGKTPNPSKAKGAFLVYDSANPNLKGSYKLPFADLIGGSLKASTAGLRAAASRLPNTDIPDDVKSTARAVITAYEKKESAMKDGANPDNEFEADGQTADEIRQEVVAQAKEIRGLCKLAGKPQLADKYIEDGKSVSDVLADLEAKAKAESDAAAARRGGKTKDKAAADASAELSTHHDVHGDDEDAVELNPVSIWNRWNKRKVA